MEHHPAIEPGRAAVITGAADGVGRAAAEKLASLGMRLCMADIDTAKLATAANEIGEKHGIDADDIVTVPTDVSSLADVERLKEAAYSAFGEVAVLMNNAGIGAGGGAFEHYDGWQKVVAVNLWGVINGVQAFTQAMIDQGTPCAIINTGSKQGITCPPGDTAYNVSKAGVKVVSEALAHELRGTDGCRITAHLLVPGFTFTGFTRVRHQEKPAGAWLPEQVIELLIEGMGKGDFYILCPDNDVTRAMDEKRIAWAAGDIIENRPPLSRWHDDWQAAFTQYMID